MLRKLIAAAATMAFAAVTMVGLTGGTASAAVEPVHIGSTSSGQCMDIGSNAPGTPIDITGCVLGYTSQQWYQLP